MYKHVALILTIVSIGAGVFAFTHLYRYSNTPAPTTDYTILTRCMTEKAPVHYHARLTINYFNRPYTLPNNIGVTPGCMHPLDTHDGTTGKIHVHSTQKYPYTLGDFFTIWGVVFNKYQLGGVFMTGGNTMVMTVNGRPNTEYEKYVLHDDDEIILTLTSKDR